jgi:hypothetical protein
MTPHPDDWSPRPELLAAYFDGELDGRPDLDALRRRVRDWLCRHPEAGAVLDDYRRLAQLWQETRPPEPEPETWRRVEECLARHPLPQPVPARRARAGRWVAALLAVAAGVALWAWLGLHDPAGPKVAEKKAAPAAVGEDAVEVFPVATAAEVTILRVEGNDTHTLVVGELPVQGPLELAGPGDVVLTSVQPDTRDQMMPQVRVDGPHRPMIWAPTASEGTAP